MPSTEKPAGFFTTFSILDPNGVHEGNPRAQKRNRRVFVCIPCHRRKLKCDKGQPCSRCTQSGSIDECVYQPLPNSTAVKQESTTPEPTKEVSLSTGSSPRVQDRTRSSYRASDGRARVSGSTHWAKVACEFEEACPYIFGTDSQWDTRYRHIKGLKYLFPSFPSMNFPFNNTCPIPPSQQDIVNQLPPRQVVEALVTCYFQSCEVTHRLFHPLQFWDELNAFWSSRDQVMDGWLSQLMMILAVGCHNAPDYLFNNTGRTQSQWIEVFLEGAQICFARSPYMAAPSLTTIRTLCLMVLAKMVEIVKGSTSSQIVSLMGFVTRLAMSLQLHRTDKLFQAMPALEAELRRRVWITIQLLDVDIAMRAGTPFLCTEQDAEAPLNINESDFRRSEQGSWDIDTYWTTPQMYTDGTLQIKLAQFLPLVGEIINTVNSPTQAAVDYDTVLGWDRRIQQKLKDFDSGFSIHSHSRADRYKKAATQRQLIEVLAHRARIAIHFAFTRSPYDQRFGLSYKAVRESSLAMLAIQELWAGSGSRGSISSNSSRSSSPSSSSSEEPAGFSNFLTDLCRDDFDTAMLVMIVAFRKEDFGGRNSDDMHASDMAWVVLRRGLMFFRQRACRSLHHFKQFIGLSIMMGTLQCVANPGAMLPTMMQVANDIEQVVLAGKQDLIWMENTSNMLVQESLDPGVSLLDMDPELLNMHIA